MFDSSRALILAGVLLSAACGSEPPEEADVELGSTAGAAETAAAVALQVPDELVACPGAAAIQVDSRWVDSEGTGNQPLRLPGGHRLHVASGTVPPDSSYLYVFATVPGTGKGCQVVAVKASEGEINPNPNPYTLRIRCIKQGPGGADECKQDHKIFRVPSMGAPAVVQSTVDPQQPAFITALLPSLSTYALAAPGGLLGGGNGKPDPSE